MPEMIILNRKTITRRLRNLGLAASIIGAILYTGPMTAAKISNFEAYSNVRSVIQEYSYSRAIHALNSFKGRLNKEQISRLGVGIRDIHPSRLVEKARDKGNKKRIILLRNAYNEYKLLGQVDLQEIRKDYLQARISESTNKLTKGNPKKIIADLDSLLQDKIIFRERGNEGLESIDIDIKIYDEFVEKEIAYFKGARRIYANFWDTRIADFATPIITKSIELLERTNPSKKEGYTKQLLGAYAGELEEYGSSYLNDDRRKLIEPVSASLKSLEEKYGIKQTK